jgi:hypothetical protein
MDLDTSKDFETGLVRVIHEEQCHPRIVFQIAQADVLLVAAKVREADERRVDYVNEAFGAAAMLHVGPAGLADRGHVEAVAEGEEGLLVRAEGVSQRRSLGQPLVLAPAAMFLLMFFDKWSKS